VLAVCCDIFLTVFGLFLYSVVEFRRRPDDDGREPAQIYGSNEVELAWTVIPILIVVVLFLATGRVIHAIEDVSLPLLLSVAWQGRPRAEFSPWFAGSVTVFHDRLTCGSPRFCKFA